MTIHYGDMSAHDPSINLGHATRANGQTIDIHYMGENSEGLTGSDAFSRGSARVENSFLSKVENIGFTNNHTRGNRYRAPRHIDDHNNHFYLGTTAIATGGTFKGEAPAESCSTNEEKSTLRIHQVPLEARMKSPFRRLSLAAGLLAFPACSPLTPQPIIPAAPEDMSSLSQSDLATYRRLDPALKWYGKNAEYLNEFIAAYGADERRFKPAGAKPVALFDWDNTIIKNDIGDAMLYYMLNNDKVLQPPGKNWRITSPYLTADAVVALHAACDELAVEGQPLPTASNPACADEIFRIYDVERTTSGKAAFAGYDYRRMEPAYAWAVQLQAGYTPAQIRAFADVVIKLNLNNPIGATQTVGSNQGLSSYIRVYDQIKDLIGTMQDNGFDVWISSASAQPVVEKFAEYVNVASDHVIGVRLLTDGGGKLTYNIQGCGDVSDGANDGAGGNTGNSMITYIEGKRCWANKVIWGDGSPAAAQINPDASKRHLFAAGDSNTDVAFLRDATILKLVINRNKKELMCNAYRNFGGKYLINPMFIEGKSQLAAGYPCSSTACVDNTGRSIPCYDEGMPPSLIPDQQDLVFAQ